MIEPPIDERYELAAVKDSLTADERKAAEHAYTVSAFDYEKAPVGSRDWTLFWSGWQKCAAQKAQPPCGADGAAEQGDIPDSVLLKAYTTASAGEILSHSWRPIFLRYARIGIAAAMRAMEAAPVAPATVAPEADPFGVDADLCGELHELDTDIGYRAASRIGQLAMLAASQREGGA